MANRIMDILRRLGGNTMQAKVGANDHPLEGVIEHGPAAPPVAATASPGRQSGAVRTEPLRDSDEPIDRVDGRHLAPPRVPERVAPDRKARVVADPPPTGERVGNLEATVVIAKHVTKCGNCGGVLGDFEAGICGDVCDVTDAQGNNPRPGCGAKFVNKTYTPEAQRADAIFAGLPELPWNDHQVAVRMRTSPSRTHRPRKRR